MDKAKYLILGIARKIGNFIGVDTDKVLHFVCSLVVVLVIGLPTNVWIGVTAGLFIGIGKEIGDEMSPSNRWSWGDILANCLGIIAGWLILL